MLFRSFANCYSSTISRNNHFHVAVHCDLEMHIWHIQIFILNRRIENRQIIARNRFPCQKYYSNEKAMDDKMQKHSRILRFYLIEFGRIWKLFLLDSRRSIHFHPARRRNNKSTAAVQFSPDVKATTRRNLAGIFHAAGIRARRSASYVRHSRRCPPGAISSSANIYSRRSRRRLRETDADSYFNADN